MQIHYFGRTDSQLLGVLHQAQSKSDSVKSLVICPPLGHEYIRTHWALRLLAKQLARKGIHVLRFDYRGHGDSFGNIEDVSSLSQWQEDISNAVDFMIESTDAPSVSLLGLRAGAGLAAEVAWERPDINSIVTWESILDGERYFEGLRTMHATMLDLWFEKTSTDDDSSFEEILGWRFQRSLIDEAATWCPDFDSLTIPQLIVQLKNDPLDELPKNNPMQKRIQLDEPLSWNRLCELESAWLRPAASRMIVEKVEDLFDRLEKKAMLESCLTGAL